MQMQQSMQTLQGAGLFPPGIGAAGPTPMMNGIYEVGANPFSATDQAVGFNFSTSEPPSTIEAGGLFMNIWFICFFFSYT